MNFYIPCYYLIRGKSIEPLIACNDDAAYYTWTAVDHTDAAQRELVLKYWSLDVDEVVEGDVCLDSRCYK